MTAAGSLWNSRPGLVDTEYLELFFFRLLQCFILAVFGFLFVVVSLPSISRLWVGVCVYFFFFIVFLAVINRGINTFFFSLYSAQGKC